MNLAQSISAKPFRYPSSPNDVLVNGQTVVTEDPSVIDWRRIMIDGDRIVVTSADTSEEENSVERQSSTINSINIDGLGDNASGEEASDIKNEIDRIIAICDDLESEICETESILNELTYKLANIRGDIISMKNGTLRANGGIEQMLNGLS